MFHPGRVPDTLADFDQQARFSFVHLDMDIYEPTLQACRWFWPRMVPGGIIPNFLAAARTAVCVRVGPALVGFSGGRRR